MNFIPEDFVAAVKRLSWLNLYLADDVDEALAILNTKISCILDEMAPIRRIQIRKKFAPWLSQESKKLMRARDYAQSRANITKNVEDMNAYKRLRNEVVSRLRREKHIWKESRIQENMHNPGNLWKNILGWLNWKSTGAPTEIIYNGVLERKPARVAACMNDFFVHKIESIVHNLPVPSSDPLVIF